MSNKEVYECFIEWLNKAWWGLPESEHLMPSIMAFYTQEEAALLTGIPFKGKSLEELAKIKSIRQSWVPSLMRWPKEALCGEALREGLFAIS